MKHRLLAKTAVLVIALCQALPVGSQEDPLPASVQSILDGHGLDRQGLSVVVQAVDGSSGRIKLAGEIWSARSFDEDARFEPGQKVSVFEIDGATAVVG